MIKVKLKLETTLGEGRRHSDFLDNTAGECPDLYIGGSRAQSSGMKARSGVGLQKNNS